MPLRIGSVCVFQCCMPNEANGQECRIVEVYEKPNPYAFRVLFNDGYQQGAHANELTEVAAGTTAVASNEHVEISAPDDAYGDGFKFLPSPSRTIDRQHAAD